MDFVGYRNTKLVEQLTRQGRITKTFKGKRTFDSDQFALLHMMASATYDWPLDDKTQGLGKMPRTYTYGWLEMARALGMTLPTASKRSRSSGTSQEHRNLKTLPISA